LGQDVQVPAAGSASAIARLADARSRASAPRAVLLCALSMVLTALGGGSALAALPDGRAWEMVSPADKAGASVQPLGFGFGGPSGGLIVASEDGDMVTYVADSPVTPEPEGNRAVEGNQVLAGRGASAWSARDIVTPHHKGEGQIAGTDQEYRAFSPDLARALVQPFGKNNPFQEPPLVPGVESEELGIYIRHNSSPCKAVAPPCFEPIVNPETDTAGTPFGGQLESLGASSDLNHVVLKAPIALTPAASAEGGLYEWNAGLPAEAQLQFVSLLPVKCTPTCTKPKAAFSPQLGNNIESVSSAARNAVSSEGSRIFWTGLKTELSETRNLYMRDTSAGHTIRVDAEEGFKAKGGKGEVHFQIASADGSRVFFTATGGLTSDSVLKGKEAGPADLYVCEVPGASGEECPAGKLTDLTGTALGFSEGGDVVGAVLGASEDGSTVYFVANGAADGASVGNCPNPNSQLEPNPEQSCNLYMVHNGGSVWEAPRLIASLSAQDNPDWAADGTRLLNLTARVSPNGRYLAFMSERELTGYDNRDLGAEALGIEPTPHDEEVFLYDSGGEGTLSCPSCNPNPEQRPTGLFDTEEAGEGNGPIVDPAAFVWKERWLAASIPGWTALSSVDAPYQSRYLLDDGRLFFNSADALVPADVNRRLETVPGHGQVEVGVTDVYEYEPGGVGSCGAAACVSLLSAGTSERESAFLDASLSGDDLFFLTPQSLVSTDVDDVADVYDARVCTESSPCITPPPPPPGPCGGEATCRSENAPPTPTFGGATSETPLGAPSVARLQTLPSKEAAAPKAKAKPLTRAQKLKRALAACRKAHKHSRLKRQSCERQARHRYGPKRPTHKGSKG
jgi:WD40-like Beta Propeller Repeat